MLPDPLHPAVVHFPIVLAVLLPLFAGGALWSIQRGAPPVRTWRLPLAVATALTLSSWLAVETGETQSELVSHVVAEQPLDSHENAAETFLTASGILLMVTAVGLSRGIVGRSARVLALVGAAGLVVGALRVGHSGGQLVYRHGAANAYSRSSGAGESLSNATPNTDADHHRR